MNWKRGRTRLAILGIVVAVFTALLWLRPRDTFVPRAARTYSVLLPAPIALAPGVYLLGKTAPAAVYLVETSQGLVLIDSGLEANASVVREQITQLGFDVKQLRAILLTHVHADHSLGAESLRSLTGAKVYAGQGDTDALREGKPREAFLSVYFMPQIACHPTTVDVTLRGDETLDFGETRIAVLAAPGHTSGSICYLLERPGLRALFTGDVVQHLSSVSSGALGTYTAYLPPLYRGDVHDALTTLKRLRDLPIPDLILPGHPRMDPQPQNPHLSAQDWQALLDGGIVEMKKLLARYDADGADFLDGSPKELLPGLHYLGDCGHVPVYCLESNKKLILFDAPGGADLSAFLSERFAALGWQGRKPMAVLLTSATKEVTAGLADLVRQMDCQVIASPDCLAKVRGLCPAGTSLLGPDEFAKTAGFSLQTIPLEGLGDSALAYLFRWADKSVLVSGRIPTKLTEVTVERLRQQLGTSGSDIGKYRNSLERLSRIRPDLWLTAVPVHGQNANLYDEEWSVIVRQNQQFLRMAP